MGRLQRYNGSSVLIDPDFLLLQLHRTLLTNLPGMNKPWIYVSTGVAASALIVVFFLKTSTPFLLCTALFSIYSGWLFFRKGERKHREVWINLSVILLIIALFEGLLLYIEFKDQSFKTSEVLEGVYEAEPDTLLGWKLIPNTTRTARKTVNGALIYQAVITTGSDGRRITPECESDSCPTILFFGDSFTYGEGVDDSLTLPYLVSKYTHSQYRTENFGVFGYGPQHMLATIERGDADRSVLGNVQHVVYQLLYPEHLYRLAGQRSWDISGPRYTLNNQDEAVFSGDFFTGNRWKYRLHTGFLNRSAIFRKLFSYTRPMHQRDKDLFLAMVRKSNQLLQKEHPSVRFHILVWDSTLGNENELFLALQESGFEIHFVNDWLPAGIFALEYKIHPLDRHPNGTTYMNIARQLVNQLNSSHSAPHHTK
jgi:hypothetical protein